MSSEGNNIIVALVGMPGAGKSEVSRIFEQSQFTKIRFGDITDEEVKKRGLPLNEENERIARELLRREHGMAAYAMLNLARIETSLKSTDVVIDGLYSWEEFKFLKDKFRSALHTVAVWAPPSQRYKRLTGRSVRPLTQEQAQARDFAEIENVNKGGPIAMADYVIKNDTYLESLIEQTKCIIRSLR
ncbi:MAG: AAA family ATPase [Dehalococcoidia bacterium]|nr:AAA family ATPase [Dehalococcoidia bacterium]